MLTEKLTRFQEVLLERRSIYDLGKGISLTQDAIISLVENAVKNAPSAFNSRSARIVLLLNENHNKFWDITINEIAKIASEDALAGAKAKIAGFKAGYGTVLFFEDQNVVKELQNNFPSYSQNFPIWSEHTSAIHQYALWTSFTAAGLGANLQHYNPLVDAEVIKEWDLQEHWVLRAQMVFGEIITPAGDKEEVNMDKALRVFR